MQRVGGGWWGWLAWGWLDCICSLECVECGLTTALADFRRDVKFKCKMAGWFYCKFTNPARKSGRGFYPPAFGEELDTSCEWQKERALQVPAAGREKVRGGSRRVEGGRAVAIAPPTAYQEGGVTLSFTPSASDHVALPLVVVFEGLEEVSHVRRIEGAVAHHLLAHAFPQTSRKRFEFRSDAKLQSSP